MAAAGNDPASQDALRNAQLRVRSYGDPAVIYPYHPRRDKLKFNDYKSQVLDFAQENEPAYGKRLILEGLLTIAEYAEMYKDLPSGKLEESYNKYKADYQRLSTALFKPIRQSLLLDGCYEQFDTEEIRTRYTLGDIKDVHGLMAWIGEHADPTKREVQDDALHYVAHTLSLIHI